MKTPEGAIKHQIRKWLKEQGAYVFSATQMGYGASTLDLLVCWRGKFVAIEVKAPGKRPTQRQYNLIDQILGAKGTAFWVESLQDVKDVLCD